MMIWGGATAFLAAAFPGRRIGSLLGSGVVASTRSIAEVLEGQFPAPAKWSWSRQLKHCRTVWAAQCPIVAHPVVPHFCDNVSCSSQQNLQTGGAPYIPFTCPGVRHLSQYARYISGTHSLQVCRIESKMILPAFTAASAASFLSSPKMKDATCAFFPCAKLAMRLKI